MRCRLRSLFLALLAFTTLSLAAAAATIEGGAARQHFRPGDVPFLTLDLSRCPVGEPAPMIVVSRGSYECARFRDRIWLRPLTLPTVLWLPFPKPLSGDFSLEFPVWAAGDGCAFVEFRLHADSHPDDWERNVYAFASHVLIGGHIACERQPATFGSSNGPGRPPFDIHTRLKGKEAIHRIAVQVRRGQVRFFVDGRRVGLKPFRPQRPISGLSLHFAHHSGSRKPYADAPAMVGSIRITAYGQDEAIPKPERDLLRELGAVEMPEGMKVTLSEAILFDFGKWALKPDAAPTLDRLARAARLHRGIIRIEGHTDNVGSSAFNKVLSELRAHVVALALARRGVEAGRLRPIGFGETRPLVPNDNDRNRAKNRRVEIVFARK